jgi:GntR family transcriptional repressor for pyruvate dehydrogenase complex
VKPGERLMTERELAQTLQVSRPVVREAINKLVNIGLIEQRQGQGTFVTSLDDSVHKNPLAAVVEGRNVSLLDLLEVRLELECNAATMAAQRATTEDIAGLESSLNQMIAEIKRGELGAHADVSFHMAISYATKNMVQIYIMKTFYDLMFFGIKENLEGLYAEPGNLDRIMKQHTDVFQCIRRHDPDAADEAMKQHILFVLNFFRRRNP